MSENEQRHSPGDPLMAFAQSALTCPSDARGLAKCPTGHVISSLTLLAGAAGLAVSGAGCQLASAAVTCYLSAFPRTKASLAPLVGARDYI